MGLESNFGLALTEMKSCLSPKSLNYLTSVLRKCSVENNFDRSGSCQENVLDVDGHSSNWSESSGNEGIGTLTTENDNGSGRKWEELLGEQKKGVEASGKHLVSVTLPFVAEEVSRKKVTTASRSISRRCLYKRRDVFQISSPSIQLLPLGTNSSRAKKDALCSHLFPICRKILAKTPPLYQTNQQELGNSLELKSVSEEVEPGNIRHSAEERDSPYQQIIGKISESPVHRDFTKVPPPRSDSLSPEPKLRTKTWKQKKSRPKGVCDFSKPITNPLYKVYNPKGYQKTDEELAGESIAKIGTEFNEWLLTLEGEVVQLDPQLLMRILRIEMQLPDTHTSLESRQNAKYTYSTKILEIETI